MTITNVGYDGPLSDTDFAQMSSHLGVLVPVVCGRNDFAVTVSSGGVLTCNVAPGSAAAPGVLSTSDGTVAVSFDAVVTSGQTRWDAVVLRRNWSAGTTTVVVVKGTAAASAPQVLPAGVDLVLDSGLDQVLALVQLTYGSTVPTAVVDRRIWGSKFFTVPSSTALPTPTSALYGMEAETPTGERFRCLSDSSGNPAWVSNALPFLSRYRNTGTTLTNNVNTTIDFNAVDVSDGGMTYSAGVVTVPKAGKYQINAGFHRQTAATAGDIAIRLLKNGATAAFLTSHNDGRNGSIAISRAVSCAVGDTLAVQALQTSGAPMTLYGSAIRYTFLDITYLGV